MKTTTIEYAHQPCCSYYSTYSENRLERAVLRKMSDTAETDRALKLKRIVSQVNDDQTGCSLNAEVLLTLLQNED